MENEKRLIDANALKDGLMKLEASGGHKYYRKGMDDTLHFHMPHIIDDAPTVDAVEVVHGEWIHHYYDSGEPIDDKWYCSECHMCNDHRRTWYCPNCGAKMDGGNEDA